LDKEHVPTRAQARLATIEKKVINIRSSGQAQSKSAVWPRCLRDFYYSPNAWCHFRHDAADQPDQQARNAGYWLSTRNYCTNLRTAGCWLLRLLLLLPLLIRSLRRGPINGQNGTERRFPRVSSTIEDATTKNRARNNVDNDSIRPVNVISRSLRSP
jgi:hypothetical protein